MATQWLTNQTADDAQLLRAYSVPVPCATYEVGASARGNGTGLAPSTSASTSNRAKPFLPDRPSRSISAAAQLLTSGVDGPAMTPFSVMSLAGMLADSSWVSPPMNSCSVSGVRA